MIKLYLLIIINVKELSVAVPKMGILSCGNASNSLQIVHHRVKDGRECLASSLRELQLVHSVGVVISKF
jgi:hypothetical protein